MLRVAHFAGAGPQNSSVRPGGLPLKIYPSGFRQYLHPITRWPWVLLSDRTYWVHDARSPTYVAVGARAMRRELERQTGLLLRPRRYTGVDAEWVRCVDSVVYGPGTRYDEASSTLTVPFRATGADIARVVRACNSLGFPADDRPDAEEVLALAYSQRRAGRCADGLRDFIARAYLPYCVSFRKGSNRAVIMGRTYKPIGLHPDRWVDYDRHALTFPDIDHSALRSALQYVRRHVDSELRGWLYCSSPWTTAKTRVAYWRCVDRVFTALGEPK